MVFKSQSRRPITTLLMLLPLLSLTLAGCSFNPFDSLNPFQGQQTADSEKAVSKTVDNVAIEKDEKAKTAKDTASSPRAATPPKKKSSQAAAPPSQQSNDIALPTFKDMFSKKSQPSLRTSRNNDTPEQGHMSVPQSAASIPLPPLIRTKASGYYTGRASQAATVHQSIWRAIAAGFQLSAHTHRPEVQGEIQRLLRSPRTIKATTQTAQRYLPYVLREVNQHGLPTEIALLPFVESGFSLTARSHANAAGLWQFIPETGRRYGLIQTAHRDQRFNLHHSTQAAIKYLHDLHQRFDGDWLLALAAYNAGEGRVEREIQKNQALGKPSDFWSLDLPNETKHYVPRLLAYRSVIKHLMFI